LELTNGLCYPYILCHILSESSIINRNYNISAISPAICVEIGCGSGIVITSLSSVLGPSSFYIAVDINPEAVQCTKETLSTHSVLTSGCINDNMLTSLMPRLAGAVDILLFNPPYVPTPSDEVMSSLSWLIGCHGN
jgi:release factor glutamine methyltransferase